MCSTCLSNMQNKEFNEVYSMSYTTHILTKSSKVHFIANKTYLHSSSILLNTEVWMTKTSSHALKS